MNDLQLLSRKVCSKLNTSRPKKKLKLFDEHKYKNQTSHVKNLKNMKIPNVNNVYNVVLL